MLTSPERGVIRHMLTAACGMARTFACINSKSGRFSLERLERL